MSDPWIALRAATRARIGLGRTGDALPIKDVLEFQLAHARARDAVHTPLDTGAIAEAVAPLPSVMVRSQAGNRETYLRRPDLGGGLIRRAGIWQRVIGTRCRYCRRAVAGGRAASCRSTATGLPCQVV